MTSDELIDAVRADGLLPPGRPVVAMLSGGRDSVCLLDLAVRLLGPEGVTALPPTSGTAPPCASGSG